MTQPDPGSEGPSGPHLSGPWSRSNRPVPRRVVQPLVALLDTEVAGGAVLLVAAIVALVWANSPVAASYEALWATELTVEAGRFAIAEDLRHWVNDLLMSVFFFVVALEIKRELVQGELRDPRAAALPLLAALGGMVVPAGLYTLVNLGGPGAGGWGIPMATDIAFAVGVLAIGGRYAPAGLRLFLLTLAIADDFGAILVIAVFYTRGLQLGWLGVAAVVVAVIVAMERLHVRAGYPYIAAAALLWVAIFSSGVHATIAGVLLGFLTPSQPFYRPEAAAEVIGSELGRAHPGDLPMAEVARLASEAVSPLARLETQLSWWSSYVVLPVFALANAGVALNSQALAEAATSPVALGIVLGLVVGKPVGIVGAAWLAVRAGGARLPDGAGWYDLVAAGALGGVGFTVALFVTGLAFMDPVLADGAKVGVLFASLLAGLVGAAALRLRPTGASWDSDGTGS